MAENHPASPQRQSVDSQVWTHLSDASRQRHRDRVRRWSQLPPARFEPETLSSIRELVTERLTLYARTYLYQQDKEIGAPKERSGPVWNRHEEEVGAHAAAFARTFLQDLQGLWTVEADLIDHTLIASTAGWWYENRRRGIADDVDDLLERCADQLSAMLVFKNLDQVVSRPHQTWWPVLAHRTIERILYAKVQAGRREAAAAVTDSHRTPIRAPSDRASSQRLDSDRIHGYMAVLLGAAGKFRFQGLGQAIKYFALLCSQWDTTDPVTEITDPLPESEPGQPQPNLPASLIVPSAEAAFLSHSQEEGEEADKIILKLWKDMVAALGRAGAEELWVLLRLHVIHAQEWNEIALAVLEVHCRLLATDDLPPDIASGQADVWFESMQGLFRNLAEKTRKRPGTLNAATLRKRFQRARSAVTTHALS